MVKFKYDMSFNASMVQQLVDAILKAIRDGEYKVNDVLPSVNHLSRTLNISRDTAFKAYKTLKQRGVIESTPAKGYRVIEPQYKIFLFLDAFSPFKDDLYSSLVENLPDNYQVDLAFHHYNSEIFETVILNAIGKYNVYLVMNDREGRINPVLKKLDTNKLLLLDWGNPEKTEYAYICQDFDQEAYKCIERCAEKIKKYKRFCYVYPDECRHPSATIDAVKRFGVKHKIKVVHIKAINNTTIKPGDVYFVFRQVDLIRLAKTAKSKALIIGKDIGIIVYNETPLYEIIAQGITTISTDFQAMGKKAAEFVKTRKNMREVIPTKLTLRESL